MIHIDVADVHKSFGGQSVLRGLSLAVMAGEHVGLVGANGTGKTTLLKILTGAELPDSGHVSIPKQITVGLLSQLPVYPQGTTAMDVLQQAFAPVKAMEAELRVLEHKMADGDPAALKRYGDLSHRFEAMGGFETEVELSRISHGLGLEHLLDRDMAKLSGGEQTRVNLGRLLLEHTDLLLLDEPTNHLDLRACEWLEEYLGTFKGTVLAVSHDRYFLDHFAKRIIEVTDGKAAHYSGNYSFYVAEREARYLEQQRLYEKEKAAYDKLSAAATQMHAWAGKNAKLHRRAFAMEKRAERLKRTEKPKQQKTLKSGFGTAEFEADDIFRIENVGHAFGERVLFSNISLKMRNGERVGLLGDNGTGKTTLLKILTGELSPDSGTIWEGPAVKRDYLPQVVTFHHPGRSLVDTLLYDLNVTPAEARNRLAAFHFTGDKVFDPVSALSGGERSRLKLCLLMAGSANLLLLDEPTNHLDIDSREWVENALDDFTQAILFVSHDRYFIEQFATRIWWLEDGKVWDFHGNYAAFCLALKAKSEETRGTRDGNATWGTLSGSGEKKPEKNNSPLLQKRRQEQALNKVEKEIERVEAALSLLDAQLTEAAADFDRLCPLLAEHERLQLEQEELYAQYELLETQ